LQVGANDGLMDDPIHFLVRKYGWCGVLLEPDPLQIYRVGKYCRDATARTALKARPCVISALAMAEYPKKRIGG
jgi:hypothetical protein